MRLHIAILATLGAALLPLGVVTSASGVGPRCHGRPATIVTGAGAQTVHGTPGDDVVVLGPGDDRFEDDLGGNDIVCGGSGDDVIIGGPGRDMLFGESGDDGFIVSAGSDLVSGGPGVDDVTLPMRHLRVDLAAGTGSSRTSRRLSLRGLEQVIGSRWADVLLGSRRKDALTGNGGADRIRSRRGDDFVQAVGSALVWTGAGNDKLIGQDRVVAHGGPGDDTILAFGGRPTFGSGAGDDDIHVLFGSPALRGGPGTDTLRAAFSSSVVIDLVTGTVTGSPSGPFSVAGMENVIGTSSGDTITGTPQANVLRGGGGDDDIFGLGGDDTIDGGGGTDAADGGKGTDVCVAEVTVDCEG